MRMIFLLTTAAWLAVASVPAPRIDAAEPPPATPAQIADWIRDLDANEFAIRERAMTTLAQTGRSAIEPVVAALPGASREVKFRAIHVLRELALSADLEVEESARTALEKIAASPEVVASRRAELSLAALNQLRQQRTVEELEKLGAKFDVTREFGGMFLAEVITTIEIGPDWRGEENDLRRLKWLANVRYVTFVGPRVTDGWVRHVGGMQNLSWLSIKRAAITDAALQTLADVPRLSFVDLKYVRIGDGAVESLAKIKQAQSLRIFGTDMTFAGADKLKAALPMAKVDYRRGGFLGVGGSQLSPIGCEIGRLTDNSAAATAGMQLNDIILRYEGQPVESFEKLTELIAHNGVGETVTIDVARDVQFLQQRESHDKNAVLGLTGKATLLGCEVTEVAAGSVAEKLKLKPGDVIVRYKRERIVDLDGLRALFAKSADPSEEQELEFIRGAKLLTLKPTLGEWD